MRIESGYAGGVLEGVTGGQGTEMAPPNKVDVPQECCLVVRSEC